MSHLVCAWHPRYYPDEPAPILGDFEGEGDSHGICARCRDRFETEVVVIENRRAALPLSRAAIRRQVERYEQKAA